MALCYGSPRNSFLSPFTNAPTYPWDVYWWPTMHWAPCKNVLSRAQHSALLLSQILDNDIGFQGISYWLEVESIVFPFSVSLLWVTDSKIPHFPWITVSNAGDIRLNEVPASKPSGALSVMPGGPLWQVPSFTDVTHHRWDEVQTSGSGIQWPLGLCSCLYLCPHLTPQVQLVY